MRLRVLVTAATALALGPALLPPATAAAPRVAVVRDGEAARMTLRPKGDEFQADTTVEPSITVNPANPRHAVVGYQAGRGNGAAANGYAVTFDAGRRWKHGLLPKLTGLTGGPFTQASDPVVAFGPENTVYFSSLAFNDTESAIVNHTSRDGGRTWDAPTYVVRTDAAVFHDKNWIAVDNGRGPGHHYGRVYAAWGIGLLLLVSYSDDQGKTWLRVPSVAHTGGGVGVIPLVLPNGDLGVLFNTGSNGPPAGSTDPETLVANVNDRRKIVLVTARGAGSVASGQPLVFGPMTGVGADYGRAVRDLRAGGGLPTADVDPRTGLIAVSWEDARFRTDEANDVVVTTSADGGLTWTPARRVNGGRPDDDVDHFTPAIAIGRDGTLRLAYRQRPGSSEFEDAPFVDTVYQQSHDGGRTWTAPLRVNRTVRTDLRFAAWSRDLAFLGDYMQVAAAGAFTYVVRCEAFRVSPRDRGALPPDESHHQRTWVAVVGPSGKRL